MNGSDVTQLTLVGHVMDVVHPDYIHTMQNTLFCSREVLTYSKKYVTYADKILYICNVYVCMFCKKLKMHCFYNIVYILN